MITIYLYLDDTLTMLILQHDTCDSRVWVITDTDLYMNGASLSNDQMVNVVQHFHRPLTRLTLQSNRPCHVEIM